MVFSPEHPTHEEVTRKAAMTLLPTCVKPELGTFAPSSSPTPRGIFKEGADG